MSEAFNRRLSDSNDKLVFALAFFGGIGAIILIRLLGAASDHQGISLVDILAIVTAISIIIAYVSYIALTKDRSGISVDRASDNVYYLGLLFTLTSLAYSLIKLSVYASQEAGVATSKNIITLLPDFGLALFSTIAGIFGRIFLQQLRNDPLEIETAARDELGLAIKQLRHTIGQVVSNLNSLTAQTSLSLSELTNNVSTSLEVTAEKNAEVIEKAARQISSISDSIDEQASHIGAFTEKTSAFFEETMQAVGDKLNAVADTPNILLNNFNKLAGALDSSIQKIEQSTELQKALSASLSSSISNLNQNLAPESFAAIQEATASLNNTINQFETNIERNSNDVRSTFEGLKNKFSEIESAEYDFQELSEGLAKSKSDIELATNAYISDLSEVTGKITIDSDTLSTSNQNIQNLSESINKSIELIDEVNETYINELSNAAEKLKKKTSDLDG